ncbi:MAG: nuclear transport factor 2 family protein [Gammaproteobacteria bacterium]|nr:nuclear transport factor 2 family protein [Gammaproteobacteria bacterium]
MDTEQRPITGAEATANDAGDTRDPLACLMAFYKAFNQRDLTLMAENWSHSDAASMSNPLGDIRRGWPTIRAVYERIFCGPARVYVEFYDYSLHCGADMFCAVGRERGYVELNGQRIDLAIRTSRIYRKEYGCWKQFHHHGSIDNAMLLSRYRAIVAPPRTAQL